VWISKWITNQRSLLPIFNTFIIRVNCKNCPRDLWRYSTNRASVRKSGLNAERSDIECPFLSRALKRVNVNIICDYSLNDVRAIHRPVQKSHDCGARTCAWASSDLFYRLVCSKKESIISRLTFRGEKFPKNCPHKVHISRLVTVIPFYSSSWLECECC